MAFGTTSSWGSDWGSWAAEASPPPKGKGWTPDQATYAMKSSMLMIGRCWAESWILCITRHKPQCSLCSIYTVTSEHQHYVGTDDGGAEVLVWTGADGSGGAKVEKAGVDVEAGAEVGEAEEDGPSDPRARALQVPGNTIVGSSRFQQFFFMYAKLMAWLRDSKVKESEITPRATHKAVIRAKKLSLKELDWAIWEIWCDMRKPTSMSIFITGS